MIVHALLAATLATSASGCGGGGNASGKETLLGQTEVEQVGKMLRVYQKGLKPPAKGAKDLPVYRPGPVPPPRGTKDLMPMAKGFPHAVNAIRSRDVLLYWKTDLSDAADASTTILAYHKEVPEKGGQVLMRDGSIKTMSASQFQEARKPEGAKTDDEMPAPPKK
jgi:hypothetical protein